MTAAAALLGVALLRPADPRGSGVDGGGDGITA